MRLAAFYSLTHVNRRSVVLAAVPFMTNLA